MARTKLLLMFLISIGMGAAAIYFANNWLEQQQQSLQTNEQATSQNIEPQIETITVVEEIPTVSRVVAAQNIPLGTEIQAKHLKMKDYPTELVETMGYSSTEDVIGKLADSELFVDDLIRTERIAEPGEGTTLAALIEPNMRAITIRVNDVIGVAGFLLPGDFVDVIYSKDDVGYASTVLKRVKILAVDQTARTDDASPIIVRAVTLELKPEQVITLVNAQSRGELQLALRNPKTEDKPVRRSYRPTTEQVTIIKGTESSRVKVKI
ncbi:Flp pilus assembly protein CpaB [Thaumasiovibrio sp. DFM-14]|uniref:Flp pilus assembly protein CpaB n=1 Tax=Thaumasiovibrio sp. DFM-14 TaxID=3384792 RepID=UPI0039A2FC47